MTHIVTIGGGTGHAQVLKALKEIPDIQITGVCPSTDSGGSTGVLQKEYDGSGYTGDLTKCIVALCNDEAVRDALSYRYGQGSLDSHSVKNLLFHALEKVSSPEKALEMMWHMCELGEHKIYPVTNEKTELCATLRIGDTISGETNIDTIAKNPLWRPDLHSISDIYLKPVVRASAPVLTAIQSADYIVISPGDLYSSIIPVLLPHGMKESLHHSDAKIVLVVNIMTKRGETDNYTATDFVQKIESFLGRPAEFILYNDAPIAPDVLLKYALEQKVELGTLKPSGTSKLIPLPLAQVAKDGKVLSSPVVLRKALYEIIEGNLV